MVSARIKSKIALCPTAMMVETPVSTRREFETNPSTDRTADSQKWTSGECSACFSFAYSALASSRMGISESASFQRVRKSLYAAFALALSSLPAGRHFVPGLFVGSRTEDISKRVPSGSGESQGADALNDLVIGTIFTDYSVGCSRR